MNEELAGVVLALKTASAEPRVWETKPGRGSRMFIPWGRIAGILDAHAGDWRSATTRADVRDGLAIVGVTLTIAGVSREGTAAVAFKEIDWHGEEYDVQAIEHAERKAFRRAASWFGVGRVPPQGAA